jgi:transcription elongation factor GreA
MAVPITKEGLEKLKAELAELEGRRPKMLTAVREAREKGDLRENAEYHAAREDLAMMEGRVLELKAKIGNAEVIDTTKTGDGKTVVFGATVKVLVMADKEEEEFTLVGEGEADPFANKILTTSPMGKALLTRKVGDVVEVPIPKGTMKIKVLEIRFG